MICDNCILTRICNFPCDDSKIILKKLAWHVKRRWEILNNMNFEPCLFCDGICENIPLIDGSFALPKRCKKCKTVFLYENRYEFSRYYIFLIKPLNSTYLFFVEVAAHKKNIYLSKDFYIKNDQFKRIVEK